MTDNRSHTEILTGPAVVDELLQYGLNPSYQIATEQDRQQLVDLMLRHHAEVREFVNAIKARPVPGIRLFPRL
jgi:hypothetical protein